MLAWGPGQAAGGGPGCPAPVITEPLADATIGVARPHIQWAPLPGATGYRVKLVNRIPEGAVIANLDTLTTLSTFEPPRPLAESSAIVRVRVTARCGVATGPETKLRFFIDTRLGCQAVTDPTIESGVSGPRLRWNPVEGGARYEVLVYDARDARLLGRGEARGASFDLPVLSDASAVAAVRPRCRDGYGPFAFAAY